jgi:hypothetical protein
MSSWTILTPLLSMTSSMFLPFAGPAKETPSRVPEKIYPPLFGIPAKKVSRTAAKAAAVPL